MAGHVAPEAAVGGPIAVVHEGDTILLDIANRKIEIEVSAEELATRLKSWKKPATKYPSGVFHKYVRLVGSAALGAVTD
jgi:dihydroxy-acid dehydratase